MRKVSSCRAAPKDPGGFFFFWVVVAEADRLLCLAVKRRTSSVTNVRQGPVLTVKPADILRLRREGGSTAPHYS